MSDLLSMRQVRAGYGLSNILEDIDLDIVPGDTIAILGRNGAGKTNLLATIMGQTTVTSGKISWRGGDFRSVPAARRAHMGIGWVPQERWIFPSLSVRENLTVAARPGLWTLKRVEDLFPRLAERRRNAGNQLSGGEQQMLAIGRALMLNPSLLLLDEPMEGLAPVIINEIRLAIDKLVRESGLSIVIVEHKAKLALSIARRALVIDRGRVIHASDSLSLLDDTPLLTRLLGPS